MENVQFSSLAIVAIAWHIALTAWNIKQLFDGDLAIFVFESSALHWPFLDQICIAKCLRKIYFCNTFKTDSSLSQKNWKHVNLLDKN